MKTDLEQRLEATLQRELSRLESVPAPPTLLPRVMKALAADVSRCPQPRWLGWSPWLRLPLIIGSSAFLGLGFWRATEGMVALGDGLVPDSMQLLTKTGSEVARALGTAAGVLLQERLKVTSMSGYVFIPLTVAGVIVSGVGTALVRLLSCTGSARTKAKNP